MSVSFDNGFLIPSTDLFSIFAELENLKEKASSHSNKKVFEELCDFVKDELSLRLFERDTPPEKSFFSAMRLFLKELPVEEYQIQTVLYPLANKTLVLLFSPLASAEELVLMTDQTSFQHYPYWNSSDPDPAVSFEEWETRKQDWNIVGYEPPAEKGLSYYLYKGDNFHQVLMNTRLFENIADHFGDFEAFKYAISLERVMIEQLADVPIQSFMRTRLEGRQELEINNEPVLTKMAELADMQNWEDVRNFIYPNRNK